MEIVKILKDFHTSKVIASNIQVIVTIYTTSIIAVTAIIKVFANAIDHINLTFVKIISIANLNSFEIERTHLNPLANNS